MERGFHHYSPHVESAQDQVVCASAPVATTGVTHVDVRASGLGVAEAARAGVVDLVVEEVAVSAPHEADDVGPVADGHALALLHEPLRDLRSVRARVRARNTVPVRVRIRVSGSGSGSG